MPSDARSAILSAVRSANGRATDIRQAEAEYTHVSRTYVQRSSISAEEILALLTERLIDYNAHVVSCSNGDKLRSAIQNALQQHGAQRVLVPENFPEDVLPSGMQITRDTNLSPAELDKFDAAVTLCSLAIAETGTLVLQSLAGQGRRATTLVPDLHVCILPVEDVVGTVPEAFERLAATATNPLTFVSGPSATADIEMTRIKGVHGPRHLHVLLLQNRV